MYTENGDIIGISEYIYNTCLKNVIEKGKF